LASLLLAFAGCAMVRPESATLVISPADAAAIDGLFGQYDRADVPGAAVVVIKNGRVAYIRGYGLAELETNTPVTERTKLPPGLAHQGLHGDGRHVAGQRRPVAVR